MSTRLAPERDAARTLARCDYPGEVGFPAAPAAGSWERLQTMDPEVSAVEAVTGVLAGLPAHEIAPRAERFLDATPLRPGTAPVLLGAVRALLWADRFAAAEPWCRRFADAARDLGVPPWEAEFRAQLALALHRRGALGPAHAEAARAEALVIGAEPPSWCIQEALSDLRSDHLVHRDHRPVVGVVKEDQPPTTSLFWALRLCARAQRQLADGRLDAAHETATTCASAVQRWGVDWPNVVPWRSVLARTRAGLDRRPDALALALEEVDRARPRAAPRVLGNSLRNAAAFATPEMRVELLREAAWMHESAGAQLELARTLQTLGMAQLRAGQGDTARTNLRRAHRLAGECRARTLTEKIRDDLAAAGMRTRNGGPSGDRVLTAAQQRVAELVKRGRSNREIADELTLTISTIEQHVTQIYRKLGLAGRHELRAENINP